MITNYTGTTELVNNEIIRLISQGIWIFHKKIIQTNFKR